MDCQKALDQQERLFSLIDAQHIFKGSKKTETFSDALNKLELFMVDYKIEQKRFNRLYEA